MNRKGSQHESSDGGRGRDGDDERREEDPREEDVLETERGFRLSGRLS